MPSILKDSRNWPTTPPVLSVIDIKKQLRRIVNGRASSGAATRMSVVVTNRAEGKTTALVEFIGERILSSETTPNIVVITPNHTVGELFLAQFRRTFPTLSPPPVYSGKGLSELLRGRTKLEIYVEECFLISHSILEELRGHDVTSLIGVGSITQPTTLSIQL